MFCMRVNSSRSAGSSVMASTAATIMREVLGVGQRLEQPPFLRFQREHRQERDGDHQQREEARARRLPSRLRSRRAGSRCLRPLRSHSSSFLCVCSTTTMAASTIAPMAMAIPPSDMMLAVMPISAHRNEGDQDRERDREDGNQRARDMPEEQQDHQRRR